MSLQAQAPAPAPGSFDEKAGRTLRPVVALVLFLLAVFAGGALLAPWLWRAVQAVAASHAALRPLAAHPFARYVNRCLLLVALVGLPLFVRGAGIRRWEDVGFHPRRVAWRRFLAGFGLGFVSLALVCTVALAVGGRAFDLDTTPGEVAGKLAGALLTAVIVAVLEELLFRGAIFGGLRRAMPWGAALAVASAVYAIVHFLGRPTAPRQIGWDTGLAVLPGMLRGFTEVGTLVPAFFSLTLAGVVLGLAYQWTGDLYASMGIHAGWIFWLKSYGFLTDGAPAASARIWGSDKLIDGWFAFAMLVVVLAVVAAGMMRRREALTWPR
ncbi:MAG: amino terminal protease self-immunity [Gemmatimonadetes bacterium]|nr:amino terminal protease self-immunity [Gemmatimonadota bacterium]